jgi:hypothetical protein
MRQGTKWVSEVERSSAQGAATQLLNQAYARASASDFTGARNELKQAKRSDPNGIAADFTLGLLSSITPGKERNLKTAAQSFQTVLNKNRGYVPALNNIALV